MEQHLPRWKSIRLPAYLLALLSVVPLATALDLGFSLYRGYIIRTDAGLLIFIDALMMMVVAAPALGLLMAAERVPSVPPLFSRFPLACVLLAAWAPIGLLRIRRLENPVSLLPEFLWLALVFAVGLIEGRQPGWAVGWVSPSLITGAALVAIWTMVMVPLPGRAMLQPVRGAPRADHRSDSPNLLLIVLDTLRRDRLGLYGHDAPTSPFLDGLASESIVFERAVAASAWTLPSHATLFTGLYPRSHGADMVEEDEKADAGIDVAKIPRLKDPMRVRPLSGEALTLAEIARQEGLETAAICGNVAYLYEVFGLDQGFESYVDEVGIHINWVPTGFRLADTLGLWRYWPYRRAIYRNQQNDRHAEEVTRLALEWLKPRQDRRFALFLNYMDPHDPYFPPGRYATQFPAAAQPANIDRKAIISGEREIRADEATPALQAYDAEIRYMDEQLAVLFRRLEAWNLLENTLVVIVGDHGESFGDHGDFRHGNGVYENEIGVPLIVRRPGEGEPGRVKRLVHHVDILPTILDVMGLPRPPALQGSSLFASASKLPVVAYTGSSPGLGKHYPRYLRRHQALYRDQWKLIQHSDGEQELYDVVQDPAELTNVAGRHPDIVESLQRDLAWYEDAVQPRFASGPGQLDEETRKRLKTLGYLD